MCSRKIPNKQHNKWILWKCFSKMQQKYFFKWKVAENNMQLILFLLQRRLFTAFWKIFRKTSRDSSKFFHKRYQVKFWTSCFHRPRLGKLFHKLVARVHPNLLRLGHITLFPFPMPDIIYRRSKKGSVKAHSFQIEKIYAWESNKVKKILKKIFRFSIKKSLFNRQK